MPETRRMSNLKAMRKKRKLSRRELSEKSGVAQGTIQRLEEGMYNVDMVKLGTLISLAKALRCKVVNILDNDLKKIVSYL